MKIKLHQTLRLKSTAIVVFLLCADSLSVMACGLVSTVKDATVSDVKNFFDGEEKLVVTFVGYSGSEYEDKGAMLEKAEGMLSDFDPQKTIVNIGATLEGIGAVYHLAKQREFVTTGIVSTQAKEYDAKLSTCVDYVFYVEDTTWGGFMESSDRLSPTSTAMVNNSDVIIGIGGGDVGRDELIAAKLIGKVVHFFPADMNHHKAQEKAEKKGLPVPDYYGGAAGKHFDRFD